jgi:hypothetical protein
MWLTHDPKNEFNYYNQLFESKNLLNDEEAIIALIAAYQ